MASWLWRERAGLTWSLSHRKTLPVMRHIRTFLMASGGQTMSRNVRKENRAGAPEGQNQFPNSGVCDPMTPVVLIVEDEFLLRMEAAEFMKDCGFARYEASNADDAIALLELHGDIRQYSPTSTCPDQWTA